MRIFGSEKLAKILTTLGLKDDEVITHPWVSRSLEKAQQKVENMHYEARKNVLKYDDILNAQRKVIFEQRRDIIFANDVSPEVDYIMREKNREIVSRHLPEENVEKWDLVGLTREIFDVYGLNLDMEKYAQNNISANFSDILNFLTQATEDAMDIRIDAYGEEVINRMKKHVFLVTIDRFWKEHLHMLDKVRQGIGLRAYGQKDPLLEYKREAFDLFEKLLYDINSATLKIVFRAKINLGDDLQEQIKQKKKQEEIRNKSANFQEKFGGASKEKIGRNDPCPCGSGKKYKNCCGK
ncbi:MAG: SEC-C domain-containing protein [Rickettsiales bacterium]|nr:SEC-C domain-containing protein [Rickettsiales bacterium]